MEMNYIVNLKVNSFEELFNLPHLNEILILCQISNTIRSSQRLLVETEKRDNSPIKSRDIFYGLINSSSYIYEGMMRTDSILRRIADIIPQSYHTDVAWIHSEINNSDSFFSKTLAKIRNGIGFHFNFAVNNDRLRKVIEKFPPIFARSTSDRKFDLVYLLADHLMAELPPFTNLEDRNENYIKNLIVELRDYSIRFCDFLDNLISVCYKEYLEITN